ncbi:hypothetical protein AERO8C_50356 [Aeromonas veronii]|uniref:Uncharacterized protein n=1 Tax=Aeromonas veronii TaxID=654 RepID=A0A653L902_AERVE|nr:hypothetical protein AERO8C_50356 [Aeromonas veronii]
MAVGRYSVIVQHFPHQGADHPLHQSGRDHRAHQSTEQTDQRRAGGRFTTWQLQGSHKGDHDQPHAKGGAEVGERHQLPGGEAFAKAAVLGEADHRRVVGEEGHQGRQGGAARQAKHRLHQRGQQHLQQADHPELAQELAQGTGEHRNPHDKEHGIEQQLVGGIEQGVDHGREAHLAAEVTEQAAKNKQYQHGFHPVPNGGKSPL